MNLETIKVGSLETNCYLVIKDNNCIIIDPGAEAEKIIRASLYAEQAWSPRRTGCNACTRKSYERRRSGFDDAHFANSAQNGVWF